jgi:hypothetical protein
MPWQRRAAHAVAAPGARRTAAVASGGLPVAPPARRGARPRPAGEPAGPVHRDRRPSRVEPLDAAREPRLSFAALGLPPIAAEACVGLSQISRGQQC